MRSISAPTGISERCMSLCLQTRKGNVNLVSAYAPTLGASPDVKDTFYEALADTVRLMNVEEPLFILGNFNGRVGKKSDSLASSQIELILARRIGLYCVRVTRSFHGVDYDTDHTLVVSKLSVKVKPKHHSRPALKPKINVNTCKHYSKNKLLKMKYKTTMIFNSRVCGRELAGDGNCYI